jgi:hypothetical protein
MFIIHGSQGLGKGNALERGQVSSWLYWAARLAAEQRLLKYDEVLKFGNYIFKNI